jgi:hypothetical protein
LDELITTVASKVELQATLKEFEEGSFGRRPEKEVLPQKKRTQELSSKTIFHSTYLITVLLL